MPDDAPLPFDPIEEARRQWVRHGWRAAAPGMSAVTSVVRVDQLLIARAEAALRPFELSFARYEVLMLLSFSRTGALPLGKIGARLQVHPASVTNAIDRLESQGFVRRRLNPADGRGKLAQISPRGRKVAMRATSTLNDSVFSTLGLSRTECAELFELLRKVRLAAHDFVG